MPKGKYVDSIFPVISSIISVLFLIAPVDSEKVCSEGSNGRECIDEGIIYNSPKPGAWDYGGGPGIWNYGEWQCRRGADDIDCVKMTNPLDSEFDCGVGVEDTCNEQQKITRINLDTFFKDSNEGVSFGSPSATKKGKQDPIYGVRFGESSPLPDSHAQIPDAKTAAKDTSGFRRTHDPFGPKRIGSGGYENVFSTDWGNHFSPEYGRSGFIPSVSAREYSAWAELARMERRLKANAKQKVIWLSRIWGRKNGQLTRQQAADKKWEDDQIIPCLLARLENKPGGEKCDTNWGILTDDNGLAMSWEWNYSELNDRKSHQFRTTPNSFAGAMVRDTYNYALNLNIQSFNNGDYEDWYASTLALDFVEYADQTQKSDWLDFAERMVDYRTGRFKGKGYDKVQFDKKVQRHFDITIETPSLISYEITRAINSVSNHIPTSAGDSDKALTVPEFNQIILLSAQNALIQAERGNIAYSYSFIENIYVIGKFMNGLKHGVVDGLKRDWNAITDVDGYKNLALFALDILEASASHDLIRDRGIDGEAQKRLNGAVSSLLKSIPDIVGEIRQAIEKEMAESAVKAAQAEGLTARVIGHHKGLSGPIKDPRDVISFLGQSYTEKVLLKETTVYRSFDEANNIRKKGRYLAREKPVSPFISKLNLALPHFWEQNGKVVLGNRAVNWVEVKIPAGTRIFEGIAAPQKSFPGGGAQILLDMSPNDIPDAWFGRVNTFLGNSATKDLL